MSEKTPPAQLAGDDHHDCKICICAIYLMTGKTPPVQVAEGQDHLALVVFFK